MAKRNTIVEKRNGCDIEVVEEIIANAKGSGMKASSYRVLTSRKPRRIIAKGLISLADAQATADKQPTPP